MKAIMSGYKEAHIIVSNMLHFVDNYLKTNRQNAESSDELIRKARVTGDWSPFSRALDGCFGKGTYKTLVRISPLDSEELELFKTYLRASRDKDSEKRAELGKIILQRFENKNKKQSEHIKNA